MSRTWPLAAYLSTAADIILAFDASAWGLGGVCYVRGIPRFYICEPLGEGDYKKFDKRPEDDDNGQQIWECLAALVVLKVWRHIWTNGRFTLGMRGDNVTALTMTMKFKASSPGVRTIAREVAHLLTSAPYMPIIYEHVPGIVNQVADVLSRRYDPSRVEGWTLPSSLTSATQTACPPRDEGFYVIDATDA